MATSISRREFLKLSAAAFAGLAPISPPVASFFAGEGRVRTGRDSLPPEDLPGTPLTGRVQSPSLIFHERPSRSSPRLGFRYFDNLFPIYGEVEGEPVRESNRIWFRVPGAFVHSSYVQPMRPMFNNPVTNISGNGFLGEITVPFADARRRPNPLSRTVYRLYYLSVYWVRGLTYDAEGGPWYKLHDDRLDIHYFVPAAAVRRVLAEELTPISPQVKDKQIHVSLSQQRLLAYEAGKVVLSARISSGSRLYQDGVFSGKYRTHPGRYRVERKHASRHMGNGQLAAESDYELPGVPWVSFFHWTGVAFHGTYWHNDYGHPQSMGCINLTPEEARWIYRWTTPHLLPGEESVEAAGTEVEIVV